MNSSLENKNSSTEFRIARLLAEKGDFIGAVETLEPLRDTYLKEKKFSEYLEVQHTLLRIYSELCEHDKINAAKEALQDLVIQEGFVLTSKTYYTLGICAYYKQQLNTAQEYFEKALKLGLEDDSKHDICHAIFGLATVYKSLGKFEEALKEIYNLEVFFQIIDLPDLKLSCLLLNANILKKLKKYDQAIDILWQAYNSVKLSKNLYLYIQLLYTMGHTYLESGETSLGKMYLGLAKRTIDPENQKLISGKIETILEKYGNVEESQYDLVLNRQSNELLEKKKGKVDFRSQFILMDLLRLFMKNPGEVYSKEALVEKVWRQEYDPLVHDNKVYVTIKRLRKLIEPDYDKPKYIFRSKQGYYLNKSARVMIQ